MFKTFAGNFLKFLFAISMAIVGLSLIHHAVRAGGTVEFSQTKIENHFPRGLKFSSKITPTNVRGSNWFNYQLGTGEWISKPANCVLPNNRTTPPDYFSCIFFLDLQEIPPQIPVRYFWEFKVPGRDSFFSQEESTVYSDPAFQWDHISQEHITIWWHDRPFSLGEEAIQVAKQTLITQQDFYGIELETPLQIVIINSLDEYNTWNIELEYQSYGEAYPPYGLTVQIIEETAPPEWMTNVFAHEISHILFFHTINQNRTHPTWLNEGLAVYHEPRNHAQEWLLVETALSNGEVIPLSDLRDSFGGTRVDLAYAQSYTAVEYLLETYGQEGLASLFAEYQSGKSTDEAFVSAFDRTLAEIEEDLSIWLMGRRASTIDRFLLPYYILLGCCCFSIMVALAIAFAIFSRKSKRSA